MEIRHEAADAALKIEPIHTPIEKIDGDCKRHYREDSPKKKKKSKNKIIAIPKTFKVFVQDRTLGSLCPKVFKHIEKNFAN